MSALKQVPLQPVPDWDHSILAAQVGVADYRLVQPQSIDSAAAILVYRENQRFWQDLRAAAVIPGAPIVLERFLLSSWFPRAPGLYHTPEGESARYEAAAHVDHGSLHSPIRGGARAGRGPRDPGDYTVVFAPAGKASMLRGGIGAIRLKPIEVFDEAHWLLSASSNGISHEGVPLAVPRRLLAPVLGEIHQRGAACVTVYGEVEFAPDPLSRLFDQSVMVPKVIVRVTDLARYEVSPREVETSVAVSFVSEFEGYPRMYGTYVTFEPQVEGSFEEAVHWMKAEYVEGKYRGRIVTDFDQTRTIFPEARLPLARVMDGQVSRGDLRETIELMHAAAQFDAYFNAVSLRGLLPARSQKDRTAVFISYAHRAEQETGWVARLRTHLSGLAHGGDFEVWDDTRIEPSQRWAEEIEQAIRRSRAAILIITPEFLASKFIRESELPLLLEAAGPDGAKIFCVYGSAVYFSGTAALLRQYQFVNDDRPLATLSPDQRELVYVKLTEQLHRFFS
jgi:hypothetical protein